MAKKNLKSLFSKFGWIGLLLAFLIINLIANIYHSRIDLTKEKRYTISKTTKDLLKAADEPISIDVFLKGNLPTGFKKLANSTEDFLLLMKENSGGKLNYRFISADETIEGTERTYSDTLSSLGANPINLTVQVKQGQESKLVFPVALIHYRNEVGLVNLYEGGKRIITANEMNSAEALMEYAFAKTLDRLVHSNKPLIAYSSGNGEPTGANTYDMQQTLRKDFQLFTFNINKQPTIPDTFKVLMIVKPSLTFSEEEKLKIDQYIMRGGKLLCFIDALHAEQDSLKFKPQLIAYDRGLDLTDLLFRYGIRINPDLVMDLQSDFLPFAVGGSSDNPQYEFLHWNYYPLFESMNNHSINKNLGLISARFVNHIDTIKANGIKKTVLLSSSSNSRIIGTPAIISLNENRNTPEDKLFKDKNLATSVLLEGRFTSFFKNHLSQSMAESLQQLGFPFLASSSSSNKMIVVSDGDMVLNDVSKDGPLPMGMNLFTMGSQYQYQFANKEFLLNCLEYLTGNEGIMETRNKDVVLRMLDPDKVKTDKTLWQWINIGLPIFIIILVGLLFDQIRKTRFAK